MIRRSGKLILILSSVVVVGAIALSTVFLGGPSQWRGDKRDDTRFDDLEDVIGLLTCHFDATEAFPETLTRSEIAASCLEKFPKQGSLQDPLTGQPYSYVILSPRTAQVCATFEAPLKRMQLLFNGRFVWDSFGYTSGFDLETGCMNVSKNI